MSFGSILCPVFKTEVRQRDLSIYYLELKPTSNFGLKFFPALATAAFTLFQTEENSALQFVVENDAMNTTALFLNALSFLLKHQVDGRVVFNLPELYQFE